MTRRSWLASLLTAVGLGALIRPSSQPCWGDCEVGDIITVGDDPQRYVVTDVTPESVWLRAADYKWVGKRMPTFGAGRTVGVWSTTTRRYQRLRHHWGHWGEPGNPLLNEAGEPFAFTGHYLINV